MGPRRSTRRQTRGAVVVKTEQQREEPASSVPIPDDLSFRDEVRDLFDSVELERNRSISDSLDTNPGLYISAIGNVSVPLTEMQARGVLQAAAPATNASLEDAMTDDAVSKIWELEAPGFELRNPMWEQKALPFISERVKESFGIPEGVNITVHLQKLLLYESGCERSCYHGSVEGTDRFATLVVTLPSESQGGELTITQHGHSTTHNIHDAYQVSYAAFSTKCSHQVLPVTNGYCLALVYELSCSEELPPSLMPTDDWATCMSSAVGKWTSLNNGEHRFPCLVYAFDNMYTTKSMQPGKFRERDAVLVERLLRHMKAVGIEVLFGTMEPDDVDVEETGITTLDSGTTGSEESLLPIPCCLSLPMLPTESSRRDRADAYLKSRSLVLKLPEMSSVVKSGKKTRQYNTVLVVCPSTFLPSFHLRVSRLGAVKRCCELLRKAKESRAAEDVQLSQAYLTTILGAIDNKLEIDCGLLVSSIIECEMEERLPMIARHVWESTDLISVVANAYGVSNAMKDHAVAWARKYAESRDELHKLATVLSACAERRQTAPFVELLALVPPAARVERLHAQLLVYFNNSNYDDVKKVLHSLVTSIASTEIDERKLCSIVVLASSIPLDEKVGLYHKILDCYEWTSMEAESFIRDCLKSGPEISRELIPDVCSQWFHVIVDDVNVWPVIDALLEHEEISDRWDYVGQILIESRLCAPLELHDVDDVLHTVREVVAQCPSLRSTVVLALENNYTTDPRLFCGLCRSDVLGGSDVVRMIRSSPKWSRSDLDTVTDAIIDAVRRTGVFPHGSRICKALRCEGWDEGLKSSRLRYVVSVRIATYLLKQPGVSDRDLVSLISLLKFRDGPESDLLSESYSSLLQLVGPEFRIPIIKTGITAFMDKLPRFNKLMRWIPSVHGNWQSFVPDLKSMMRDSALVSSILAYSGSSAHVYKAAVHVANAMGPKIFAKCFMGTVGRAVLTIDELTGLVCFAVKAAGDQLDALVYEFHKIIAASIPKTAFPTTVLQFSTFLNALNKVPDTGYAVRCAEALLATHARFNWWALLSDSFIRSPVGKPIALYARRESRRKVARLSFDGNPFKRHTPNPNFADGEEKLKMVLLEEAPLSVHFKTKSAQERDYLINLPKDRICHITLIPFDAHTICIDKRPNYLYDLMYWNNAKKHRDWIRKIDSLLGAN